MLFRADDLRARYGRVQVLHGVSIEVGEREIVGLIGPNGAGKTTVARTLSGLMRGATGRVTLDGDELLGLGPPAIVRAGVIQVPEGRQLFPNLTLEENLMAGAYTRRGAAEIARDRERMLDRFPILRERAKQEARLLSGGEQQMLAIARALMSSPRLLILDEPSQGLAPRIVHEIGDLLRELAESGLSILLIEQNLGLVRRLASRVMLLESGRTMIAGHGDDVLESDQLRRTYLGTQVTA